MKTILFTSMCVLASAAVARAGGKEGSIGVGIESQLATTGGAAGFDALSINYDAGKFHVGGYLGYDDPAGGGNTFFEIGARFFYHVHMSPMSDFGVGGSIGIALDPFINGMTAEHHDDVYIEPAFQFRAFITPNVALSFTGGLVIGTVDASGVDFGGNVEGLAGIHYYFF